MKNPQPSPLPKYLSLLTRTCPIASGPRTDTMRRPKAPVHEMSP